MEGPKNARPTDHSHRPALRPRGRRRAANRRQRRWLHGTRDPARARESDVPLRHDPALAGALATLDIGAQIPPELFRAVAEVLAFVYKMNGKG